MKRNVVSSLLFPDWCKWFIVLGGCDSPEDTEDDDADDGNGGKTRTVMK